jgi:hypothetical protein
MRRDREAVFSVIARSESDEAQHTSVVIARKGGAIQYSRDVND